MKAVGNVVHILLNRWQLAPLEVVWFKNNSLLTFSGSEEREQTVVTLLHCNVADAIHYEYAQ